ncbi:UNVERIFIED_CONTAM: Cytochrome c oxidase subunit 3 [Trichonephila clavipes]
MGFGVIRGVIGIIKIFRFINYDLLLVSFSCVICIEEINVRNSFIYIVREVPLLNTVILLASGVSGFIFLSLQGLEYYIAEFRIGDSVFGSVFFIATCFRSFHNSHFLEIGIILGLNERLDIGIL